jgi:predicted small lipoprotein YifL
MMKMDKRWFKSLIGLALVSILAACGGMGAYYYTAVEQPPAVSDAIRSAGEFKVRPLNFSAVNPSDLGYKNTQEWRDDLKEVPQAFAEAFPILWKEANIDNKRVTMIGKDERVRSGIVVEADVKQINLKWNAFSNQPDEYIVAIAFTNAATGQKLYRGTVNVNSRSGNPYAQAWGMSFSGRIKTAAYNTAWVLTRIMVQGRIDPEKY